LKKETVVKDKTKLLEKELSTLTDQIESLNKKLEEVKDLKDEIKGLKLFLGRVYPEFKTWFPEIMQKVYKKK
jgi:predicted  nucleic acid-binding Zn-ribbon protein